MVLNINRESMADVGFSPPTRVFEAAGAGACLISDAWPGIDQFFQPSREILVAQSAPEVVNFLREVPTEAASTIGKAMRRRTLREHTYALRAQQVHSVLTRTGVREASSEAKESSTLEPLASSWLR
jgi:spore maturation protein CgeB